MLVFLIHRNLLVPHMDKSFFKGSLVVIPPEKYWQNPFYMSSLSVIRLWLLANLFLVCDFF